MFRRKTGSLLASVANDPNFDHLLASAAKQLGMEFVASIDIRETLNRCEEYETTCTFVDFGNAEFFQNGSFARRFCDAHALLVLIPSNDVHAAFQAGSFGAINVIEKPATMDELVANLQSALASESKLEEIVQKNRFESLVFASLTAREKAILHLLMDGEPNKRVAALLDIGLRTVESDRAHVMKKLSVSTFVELVSFVARAENNVLQTRKDIFSRILPTRFRKPRRSNSAN